MDEFANRPLERAAEPETPVAEPKRVTALPLVGIAVAGLVVGAAAAWWWIGRSRTPAAVSTVATNGTGPGAIDQEPSRALPPLSQMDTFLRALLGALSSHPDAVRWLASDNLIGQMASAIDRVSRGQSPARDVPMLHPRAAFEITAKGGQMRVDPQSFRRYDPLAMLVDALDARAVAEAYRTIQPRLEEAYRGLGRSENSVDDAVRVGLELLIDTPVPPETAAMVHGKGATYAFADAKYEQLAPVQKQLLRMGPANARRIQARLREILTAIETMPAR
jgi:hypothetical protein